MRNFWLLIFFFYIIFYEYFMNIVLVYLEEIICLFGKQNSGRNKKKATYTRWLITTYISFLSKYYVLLVFQVEVLFIFINIVTNQQMWALVSSIEIVMIVNECER